MDDASKAIEAIFDGASEKAECVSSAGALRDLHAKDQWEGQAIYAVILGEVEGEDQQS